MNLLTPAMRSLFVVLTAALALPAQASGTPVPSQDLPGLKDPPGLQRYKDAVLILREDVEYDELSLPTSPAKYGRTPEDSPDWMALKAPTMIDAAGRRTRMIYVMPAGRSGLEVVRNYQTQLGAQGYKTLFECNADACGESTDTYYSDSSINFPNFLYPQDQWKSTESSPHGCAVALRINSPRYAVMKHETAGVVAILTHTPDITSAYCDEAAWAARVIATVVVVKPKPIEQAMVKVGADEMSRAMAETGRVALYGILFDTAKAEIKSESKPALDEIAKLLKQEASLKLHVVGHTDSQGALQANFDLSKRRAEAVKVALTRDYGIAAARLTGNGVSSLAPVATNETEEGRARNRRVELVPF